MLNPNKENFICPICGEIHQYLAPEKTTTDPLGSKPSIGGILLCEKHANKEKNSIYLVGIKPPEDEEEATDYGVSRTGSAVLVPRSVAVAAIGVEAQFKDYLYMTDDMIGNILKLDR